jgi:hypothetical protein
MRQRLQLGHHVIADDLCAERFKAGLGGVGQLAHHPVEDTREVRGDVDGARR